MVVFNKILLYRRCLWWLQNLFARMMKWFLSISRVACPSSYQMHRFEINFTSTFLYQIEKNLHYTYKRQSSCPIYAKRSIDTSYFYSRGILTRVHTITRYHFRTLYMRCFGKHCLCHKKLIRICTRYLQVLPACSMIHIKAGPLGQKQPTNKLKIRILQRYESNRVNWFQTRFLSLVYL